MLTNEIMLSVLQTLYENAFIKEIRFLIEFDHNKFDKLSPEQDFRIDWYYPDQRIRLFIVNGKHEWLRITGANGLVKKQTESIPPQDINKLDKTCLFKLIMQPKYPYINGIEVFLEKVTAKRGNQTVVFYSTEAENKEDLDNKHLVKLLDGYKNMKRMPNMSLSQLANRLLDINYKEYSY